MDGESYEDPALAEFLNDHFICIKVDRDERPDVDARYQRAVQALTRQGGWPLTAFLTPAGEVFYGGTYFPPDGAHGRPGFRTVLESVLEAYRSRRGQVQTQADAVRRVVGEDLDEAAPGEASLALLDDAVAQMTRVFDPVNGGFGRAPKFPHPGAMTLLLHRWYDRAEEPARHHARPHAPRHGARGRLRPARRRVPPLQRGRRVDRAALREDVVRQLRAAQGLPRRVRAVRHRGVRRRRPRHRAAGCARCWPIPPAVTRRARTPTSGSTTTATISPGPATRPPRCSAPEELEVAAAYYDIGTAGEMHHNPSKNVLFVAATVAAIAARLGRQRAGRPRATLERARPSSSRRVTRARRRSSIAPATPTGTR